ncbi:hypothetical protein [Paenibacillus protaetiae]|uniref:hypothetical protein n=1 Tax=Paenibacillus protaetiae TaxID=2509456 RepID=UPI0026BCE308
MDESGARRYTVLNDERKTVQEGAATTVWCAAGVQLEGMGGVYCENVDIAELADPSAATATGVFPWAVDPEAARLLWKTGEQLTGIPFEW